METIELICGNCFYYHLRTNVDGICRRLPPVPYPSPQKNIISGQIEMNVLSVRPIVGFNLYGCGEFVPRQSVLEQEPSGNGEEEKEIEHGRI